MNITLTKSDEVVMQLLHYFITEQGYSPVILHGAKDEIWLENSEADYKIVRIVTNYIHNNEQLNFDLYRTRQIMRKIKYKMLSLHMNTLSLFLNLGDAVDIKNIKFKNIDCAALKTIKDVKNYNFILNSFPNILEVEQNSEKGADLFIKLTEEINQKNIEETKKAEDVFTKKEPIVTKALIFINVLLFIFLIFRGGNPLDMDAGLLYQYGALTNFKTMGYNYIELYRIITSSFLHGGIIHLLCNMYSLYVIGPQLESFFGKTKFLLIYLGSIITSGLLSMLFLGDNVVTVGASGAIFGLLGALLYFGYHYRVYLGGVIKSQIIPLIILNLFVGYMVSGINNFAHIGGLIGGILTSMIVGVKYRSGKSDQINGLIMSIIFIGFLVYMIFFRVS